MFEKNKLGFYFWNQGSMKDQDSSTLQLCSTEMLFACGSQLCSGQSNLSISHWEKNMHFFIHFSCCKKKDPKIKLSTLLSNISLYIVHSPWFIFYISHRIAQKMQIVGPSCYSRNRNVKRVELIPRINYCLWRAVEDSGSRLSRAWLGWVVSFIHIFHYMDITDQYQKFSIKKNHAFKILQYSHLGLLVYTIFFST